MKNLIFSILIFLVGIITEAQVVKVIGTNCNTNAVLRNGSGIAFLVNGANYVVSSDHVTPETNGICYQISDESGKHFKAVLESSDWEHGLSLLKLPAQFNSQFRIEDFESTPRANSNINAQTFGFPAASKQALRDSVRIVMTDSTRSPFVEQKQMLEFIGPQVEFGMSGGALFDVQSGKIIGLLSHQRVMLQPGSSSVLSSASVGDFANHGLAIPSARVISWINSQLSGKESLYATAANNQVKAAGLLFRESRRNSPVILAKSSKGGDGVGVGGDEDQTGGASVEIELQNLDQFKSQLHLRPEFAWINRLTPSLLKDKKVRIQSVIFMNAENSQLETIKLSSLTQFISLLREGRAIPILEGAELNSASRTENLQISNFENRELAELAQLIQNLQLLKHQYGQIYIAPQFKNSLASHPGWKSFFEHDFELAVQFKTFCESL